MRHGHGSRDLRQFSFFLDVQSPIDKFAQAGKSESVAQLINRQLRKTKNPKQPERVCVTRFKYVQGQIDYIVVDDEFLDGQMAVQVARSARKRVLDDCFGELVIEGKSKRALDYLK